MVIGLSVWDFLWIIRLSVLEGCDMMQDFSTWLSAFDLSLLPNQFLLLHNLALLAKYGWSLITVFPLGRTWTNYLLKQKQLKWDTVRLKQLACLKFADCQLHLCILLAARETTSKKFVCSPKEPKNLNHQCMLM